MKSKLMVLGIMFYILSMLFAFASVVSGQTVTVWYEPNGHMAEISSAETFRRFDQSLDEVEAICDIDFVRVADSRRAQVRVYFRHQSQMEYGALGLAYTNKGYILINNSRLIGLASNPERRYAQSVISHEMFHMLGVSHSPRGTSWMHGGNMPRYYDRLDVQFLQRRYGRNNDGTVFYPVTLGQKGDALRASQGKYNQLWEERLVLLAERDGSTDKVYRTAKQMEVITNIILIIREIPIMVGHAQDWFAEDLYWRGQFGYFRN